MTAHVRITENPAVPVSFTVTTARDEFEFAFVAWEKGDLDVYVDTGDGPELQDPSTWDVTFYDTQESVPVVGGYGGGLITLVDSVSSCTVIIDRSVVEDRDTDFSSTGPLSAKSINSDLDRLSARDQDLSRRINRCLRVPVGETPGEIPTGGEGKLLGRDTDGDWFWYDPDVLAQVVAQAENAFYMASGLGLAIGPVVNSAALLQTVADTIAGQGGGVLYFGPGSWLFDDNEIDWPDGVNLIGAGRNLTRLDFSQATSFSNTRGIIQLQGAGPSDTVTVNTGIAAFGATSIAVTGTLTNYANGDLIQIRSTEMDALDVANLTLATYAFSTAFTDGQIVYRGGNFYLCTTAGTSAASGGPTGTSNPITDNTVTWYYVNLRDKTLQKPWAATACALGETRVTTGGKVYVCCTAGTPGASEPTSDASTKFTSGSAEFRYVGYYNARKAEFARVRTAAAGTITLDGPLKLTYPLTGTGVTHTVEVVRVAMAAAQFRGFTLVGKGLPSLGAQNPDTSYPCLVDPDIGIECTWAEGVIIEDVAFEGVESWCIYLQSAFDWSVSKVRFMQSATRLDSQQYGIYPAGCSSKGRLSDFYASGCRHVLSTDGGISLAQPHRRGIPNSINVENGSVDGCWQSAVDTHRAGYDITGDSLTINTVSAAVKSRSRGCSWSNIIANGETDLHPYSDALFTIYYDGGDCQVNNVRGFGGYDGFVVRALDQVAGKVTGTGMILKGQAFYGLRLGSGDTDIVGKIALANVVVEDPGGYQVYLDGYVSDLVINGFIGDGGTYGVRTDARRTFGRLVINGFSITDTVNEALYLENLTDAMVGAGTTAALPAADPHIRIRNSQRGTFGPFTVRTPDDYAGTGCIHLDVDGTGTTDMITLLPCTVTGGGTPDAGSYAVDLDDAVTNSRIEFITTNLANAVELGAGAGNTKVNP